MKNLSRFLLLFLAAIALVAPAQAAGSFGTAARIHMLLQSTGSGTINQANTATAPALTPGSFAQVKNVGPGPQLLQITIQNATWVGTLHVYSSPDGTTLPQAVDSTITRFDTGATGAIASGVAATYFVSVPAGTAYVAASAWTSGSAIISLATGALAGSPPGSSGGGGTTNATIVGPVNSSGATNGVVTNPNYMEVVYTLTGADATANDTIPVTSVNGVAASGTETDMRGWIAAGIKVLQGGTGITQFSGSVANSAGATTYTKIYWDRNDTISLPWQANLSLTVGATFGANIPHGFVRYNIVGTQSGGTTMIKVTYKAVPYIPAVQPTTPVGTQNSATLPGIDLIGGVAYGGAYPSLGAAALGALSIDGNSNLYVAPGSGLTWPVTSTQLPASLGQLTNANSFSVVPAYGTIPAQVALFNDSANANTCIVSLLDDKGNPVPFVDSNAVKYPNVTLALAANTAYGLGYLVTQTAPDSTHFLNAIGASARKVIITIGAYNIRTNAAGTSTSLVGSGNGIDATLAAPNATSNYVMNGGGAGLTGGVYSIPSPFDVFYLSSLATATAPAQEIPAGTTYEQVNSAGTPITTATTVTLFSAGGSGIKHYLRHLSFVNSGATATEVQILDGSTVIYDFYAPASGGGLSIPLTISFVGTANTALSIKTLTAGCSLLYNANGYKGSAFEGFWLVIGIGAFLGKVRRKRVAKSNYGFSA